MPVLLLVGMGAFLFWYAGFIGSLIDSGSWIWFSGFLVLPLVLGYIVGDERDRADYHRLRDWLVAKLGSR